MRRWWGALWVAAAVFATLPVRAEEPSPYRVCAHAPMTGAAPIPHHESRFGQIYFDYVNSELGGVDGHPVTFTAMDDRYFPAGARDVVLTASNCTGLTATEAFNVVSARA